MNPQTRILVNETIIAAQQSASFTFQLSLNDTKDDTQKLSKTSGKLF